MGETKDGCVIGHEVGERAEQFLHLGEVGFPVRLGVKVSAQHETSRWHRRVAGQQNLMVESKAMLEMMKNRLEVESVCQRASEFVKV